MEVATLDVASEDWNQRTARAGQLMALNHLLNADPRAAGRGEISGLYPIEVHWRGGTDFAIVCLVGADAAKSELLTPHRARAPMLESARIEMRSTRSLGDSPWSKRVLEVLSIPSSETPPTAGERRRGLATHADRTRMARFAIETARNKIALRTWQGRAQDDVSVFSTFWERYAALDMPMRTRATSTELRRATQLWLEALGCPSANCAKAAPPPPPPPPPPVRPNSIASDDREWPAPAPAPRLPGALLPHFDRWATKRQRKGAVDKVVRLAEAVISDGGELAVDDADARSSVSSLSEADTTILSMAANLPSAVGELHLEDVQNLWKVTSGTPDLGGIWGGGDSPTEIRFRQLHDVAACAPWSTNCDLFEPWRARAPPLAPAK